MRILITFGAGFIGSRIAMAFARKRAARFLFLSTFRVYSIASLRAIKLEETPSRFEIAREQTMPAISVEGIREDFPTSKARSFYGTTKLASEMLTQEYGRYFGLKTGVFRGSCLTGPAHSGTELHGFLSCLVKCAVTGRPYVIYGYGGKQIRDNMHFADLVRFFRTMQVDNTDCVFGTRFPKESKVVGYPILKLILNRIGNSAIRLLFGLRYNDVTNACKLYRRHVIQGLQPIFSYHYNLTVELPLKAIVRGYTYSVVPNNWTDRTQGISKLKIKEMGSRYVFIILYCFIEKWLSRGDYHRKTQPPSS